MLMTVRKFATLVAAGLLVAGCGGGGDSGTSLLEIDAVVGGRPVAGFASFPGTRQSLFVPVGLSLELRATRPVAWDVFVNGALAPGRGNTYTSAAGTTLQEVLVTNAQYVANTFGFAPGPAPFQITVAATSLDDPGQVTTIDVFVTN